MDGEGKLISKDGSRYQGGFKEGQKSGRCIEITAEGIRFEGSYLNGARAGEFKEYDRNNRVIAAGYYENGRRIERNLR